MFKDSVLLYLCLSLYLILHFNFIVAFVFRVLNSYFAMRKEVLLVP